MKNLKYWKDNGGFDNFNNWNKEEIKDYFNCSNYVSLNL